MRTREERLEAIRKEDERQAHDPSKADDPICFWCTRTFLLEEIARLERELKALSPEGAVIYTAFPHELIVALLGWGGPSDTVGTDRIAHMVDKWEEELQATRKAIESGSPMNVGESK